MPWHNNFGIAVNFRDSHIGLDFVGLRGFLTINEPLSLIFPLFHRLYLPLEFPLFVLRPYRFSYIGCLRTLSSLFLGLVVLPMLLAPSELSISCLLFLWCFGSVSAFAFLFRFPSPYVGALPHADVYAPPFPCVLFGLPSSISFFSFRPVLFSYCSFAHRICSMR